MPLLPSMLTSWKSDVVGAMKWMRDIPARTAVCTAAVIECDLPAPRPPRNSQHHDRSGGGSCASRAAKTQSSAASSPSPRISSSASSGVISLMSWRNWCMRLTSLKKRSTIAVILFHDFAIDDSSAGAPATNAGSITARGGQASPWQGSTAEATTSLHPPCAPRLRIGQDKNFRRTRFADAVHTCDQVRADRPRGPYSSECAASAPRLGKRRRRRCAPRISRGRRTLRYKDPVCGVTDFYG